MTKRLCVLCSSCEAKVKTNLSAESSNQVKVDTVNKKIMKTLEELINLEEPYEGRLSRTVPRTQG